MSMRRWMQTVMGAGVLGLAGCGGLSGFGAADGAVLTTCPTGSTQPAVLLVWSGERCRGGTPIATVDEACALAASACASGRDIPLHASADDLLLVRASGASGGDVTAARTYCYGPDEVSDAGYVFFSGTAEVGDGVATFDLSNAEVGNRDLSGHPAIQGEVSVTSCGQASVDSASDSDSDG